MGPLILVMLASTVAVIADAPEQSTRFAVWASLEKTFGLGSDSSVVIEIGRVGANLDNLRQDRWVARTITYLRNGGAQSSQPIWTDSQKCPALTGVIKAIERVKPPKTTPANAWRPKYGVDGAQFWLTVAAPYGKSWGSDRLTLEGWGGEKDPSPLIRLVTSSFNVLETCWPEKPRLSEGGRAPPQVRPPGPISPASPR